MPPIFTASLASSLDRKSALLVKEAEAGERVQPNTVYIAPGGQHMTVSTDFCIGLNSDPPENSCRPAVDVLFRSVGQAYKRNILALVMTGMGRDGASGVEVLKKTTNCYCITQSEQSCTVYGMPRSVDELGLSDERVDLSQLSTRIQTLLKGSGVRVGL
jgi:two-component system chemotaxis response regulator CheB